MTDTFLIISLFFPRIMLYVYYTEHIIPYNTIPLALETIMILIAPRLLILLYIVENLGIGSFWFWLHLIAMVLVWGESLFKTFNRE